MTLGRFGNYAFEDLTDGIFEWVSEEVPEVSVVPVVGCILFAMRARICRLPFSMFISWKLRKS